VTDYSERYMFECCLTQGSRIIYVRVCECPVHQVSDVRGGRMPLQGRSAVEDSIFAPCERVWRWTCWREVASACPLRGCCKLNSRAPGPDGCHFCGQLALAKLPPQELGGVTAEPMPAIGCETGRGTGCREQTSRSCSTSAGDFPDGSWER